MSPHVPNKWSISFYLTFLLLPYTLLDKFKTKYKMLYNFIHKDFHVFLYKTLIWGKKKAADVAVLNAYLGGF